MAHAVGVRATNAQTFRTAVAARRFTVHGASLRTAGLRAGARRPGMLDEQLGFRLQGRRTGPLDKNSCIPTSCTLAAFKRCSRVVACDHAAKETQTIRLYCEATRKRGGLSESSRRAQASEKFADA